MKNNKNHLRLFVYGTLKRGFWNYDRFCSQAVNIEPATTWSRRQGIASVGQFCH